MRSNSILTMSMLVFALATETILAQTVGRIELQNNTGSPITYNLWSSDKWVSWTIPSGQIHGFDDSGRLNFLVKTERGDGTAGSVQYWLIPGSSYEFAQVNGVWDLWDTQQHFPTRTAPGLVLTSDGQYVPIGGYEWVDENDSNNFDVRLEPHLTESADGKNFQPAPGYVWVNKDDPNNFDVEIEEGLTENQQGQFVPSPGYDWLFPLDNSDPGNRKNFYVWRPPSGTTGSTLRAGSNEYDAQGGVGSGGGANRSPASDPITAMEADMLGSMIPDAKQALIDHNAAIDEAVDHITNGKGGGDHSGGGNGGNNSGNNEGSASGGNSNDGGHHEGAGDSQH